MLLLADVVSQTKHMFNTEEREREREIRWKMMLLEKERDVRE